MLFIVGGFLGHSVSDRDEFDEPKPASRRFLLFAAFANLIIAGLWTYLLFDLLAEDEPSWFMIILAGLWIPLSLLDSFRNFRGARSTT